MESPGWRRSRRSWDRENLTMDSVSYLNPAQLHSTPAFTQAVRIPAGRDLIVIGGQNGVDSSGSVVVRRRRRSGSPGPSATYGPALARPMPILNTSFGGQS